MSQTTWEIIDDNGVIYAGYPEPITRMIYQKIVDREGEYKIIEWDGDLKLIEVHAIYR